MQEIMILFAEKYGLTINEVMAEMEKVLSAILCQWYRVTYTDAELANMEDAVRAGYER